MTHSHIRYALFLMTTFIGLPAASAEPRTHDGYYLQVAAGVGHYNTSASLGATDTTYSGLTIPASFMTGGTLFQRLVLGGGFFVDTAPSPTFELNGQEPAAAPDFKQLIVGMGGLVDFYVWPDEGLHFPVFLGWGGLESIVDGNAWGSDPTGFIMYTGAGYDFWIADEWSLGALGRVVIAPSQLGNVDYLTVSPSLLATITYH